jgi:shikimate 5-dehydrogenase
LVIGAGGAARAIVYGLKLENAKVTITNRTIEKAEKLSQEFGTNCKKLEHLNLNDYDVFINTTSVGMYPDIDSSVFDSFPNNRVVMDIVYKPLKTKFLKIAETCDCEIITGEKMLIHQDIAQQKIWTGNEPEFAFMSKCFFEIKD